MAKRTVFGGKVANHSSPTRSSWSYAERQVHEQSRGEQQQRRKDSSNTRNDAYVTKLKEEIASLKKKQSERGHVQEQAEDDEEPGDELKKIRSEIAEFEKLAKHCSQSVRELAEVQLPLLRARLQQLKPAEPAHAAVCRKLSQARARDAQYDDEIRKSKEALAVVQTKLAESMADKLKHAIKLSALEEEFAKTSQAVAPDQFVFNHARLEVSDDIKQKFPRIAEFENSPEFVQWKQLLFEQEQNKASFACEQKTKQKAQEEADAVAKQAAKLARATCARRAAASPAGAPDSDAATSSGPEKRTLDYKDEEILITADEADEEHQAFLQKLSAASCTTELHAILSEHNVAFKKRKGEQGERAEDDAEHPRP
jgi:hypothetical protein